MKEFFLAIVSFIAALLVVLLFVALGWYLLWVLVLSRFKFVKDLLNSSRGVAQDRPSEDQPKTNRSKSKRTRKD